MFKAVITRAQIYLLLGMALLCLQPGESQAAIEVISTRIWPAQDYTRLTLESRQPIRHTLFTVENPDRLVIDLQDVELNEALKQLNSKTVSDDPYIKSVRVGQFKPGMVRLVLDLKEQIKPQLFDLAPAGEYGYRLVLDIYPAASNDPLMALLSRDRTEPINADKQIDKLPLPDGERDVAKQRLVPVGHRYVGDLNHKASKMRENSSCG